MVKNLAFAATCSGGTPGAWSGGCNNTDPAATGCSDNTSNVYAINLKTSGGATVGYLQIRWSNICYTNWTRVQNAACVPDASNWWCDFGYFAEPKMQAVEFFFQNGDCSKYYSDSGKYPNYITWSNQEYEPNSWNIVESAGAAQWNDGTSATGAVAQSGFNYCSPLALP